MRRLTQDEKDARVAAAKVPPSQRGAHIRKACEMVKARAAIDFVKDVRGKDT